MPTGTIKFFNSQKGFGFVVADEGNKEIFLPTASLNGIDAAKLKQGQRVSFEIETEARGPKAVALALLERAPPPPVQTIISVFHDPSSEESEEVLDALRTPDRQLREVDIIASPPTAQDLRKWSLLLGGTGKGLVRRFHPMFHALQLDDRFIGPDEFWTGVAEHPVLIETPFLVLKDRVGICKSAEDVAAFLSPAVSAEPPKAKGLSPRLAAMIRGEDVPPPAATPAPVTPVAVPKPEKPVAAAAVVAAEPAQPEKIVAAKPEKPAKASAPKEKPKAVKTAPPKTAKSAPKKAPAKKAVAKKPAPKSKGR